MRGYLDYFNLALHWLCPTAPHLLRRVAAGMDRGGRFYQSEWPLRQGTRGRWRGLYAELGRERKMQETMLAIKRKYGKNAILKGMNLEEGATAKDRNDQIGGHRA